MSPHLTTSLALAILASVVIAMAQFLNTYTGERYRKATTAILVALTILYFLASTGFLIVGIMEG